MAINYAGFQVQAPRTNQQGLIEAARGMERRADRHRYGIAQGADIALNSLQQQKQLQKQYDEAVASGNNQAAQGIGQQLDGLMAAQNNFLQGHERKELRGIAAIADPYEREMALKQAMAYSPDYLQQRQQMQRSKQFGTPLAGGHIAKIDGKWAHVQAVQTGPNSVENVITPMPEGYQPPAQDKYLTPEQLANRNYMESYYRRTGDIEADLAKANEQLEAAVAEEKAKTKAVEDEKASAKRFATITDDAYNATIMKPRIEEFEAAVESANTGFYQPMITWVSKAAGRDVSANENLDSLSVDFALEALMQMPGVKTDEDFRQKMKTLANEGRSKEANMMILQRIKDANRRSVLTYEQMNAYKNEFGENVKDFMPSLELDLDDYKMLMFYKNKKNKGDEKYKEVESYLKESGIIK